MTNGEPGNVTPVTSRAPAPVTTSRAWYQIPGTDRPRCMSLDIMALPEVLCEPGKDGKPLVVDYKGGLHDLDESIYEYVSDTDDESWSLGDAKYRSVYSGTSQDDIEANFAAKKASTERLTLDSPRTSPEKAGYPARKTSITSSDGSSGRSSNALPPRPYEKKSRLQDLEGLLIDPIESTTSNATKHRRTRSEPTCVEESERRAKPRGKQTENSVTSFQRRNSAVALKRVNSFGQVDQEQPSLLDQARRRAASFEKAPERYL